MKDDVKENPGNPVSVAPPVITPGEIIIGTITAIDHTGSPLVDYPENPTGSPLAALATLGITPQHIGRQAALLFTQGDPTKPVVMGLIHSPLDAMIEQFEHNQTAQNELTLENLPVDEIKADNKKLVFEAQDEIVLKCGESSITLTKSGKILIRGKYLVSRSSGVNRILGGAVQVN